VAAADHHKRQLVRPQQSSNLSKIEVAFPSNPGERIFGLGQHQHGLLDNKGAVIDLEQRNTEVCIPFYISTAGYGFLWNNPGVGRVELGTNLTRWVMEATRGIDYYIVAGDTPAEILEKYVDATGHPPLLPDFALGFWQCKLRYRTQEELLAVVREYRRRGLPLAVIVSDYFHWRMMGDWAMDPHDRVPVLMSSCTRQLRRAIPRARCWLTRPVTAKL
jgi:alpha-D-xyloside xylohydrolase